MKFVMEKLFAVLTAVLLIGSVACAAELSPAEWSERMDGELELLRGLDYEGKVPAEFIPGKEIRKYAQAVMERNGENAEALAAYGMILKLLGLVPEEMDLTALVADLRTEQTRALYDPAGKKILLNRGGITPRWNSPLIKRTMLQLEINETEFLMATMMSYALLSENFGDGYVDPELSFDELTARRAAMDGGAVLLMCEYLVRNTGFNIMILPDPDAVIRQFLPLVTYIDTEKLAAAPRAIGEYIKFPYTDGSSFIFYQKKVGSFMLMDAVYANPPMSTEQIMHPEKYYEKRDNPIRVSMPDLSAEMGQGARLLFEDTWGEFGLKKLISGWLESSGEAEAAASGWGGDRLALYELPGGKKAVAWFTTWDGAEEADLFESVLKRGARAGLPEGVGFDVQRIGRDVAFITGLDDPAPAMAKLWQSIKIPVVAPPPVPGRPDPEKIILDVRAFIKMFTEKSEMTPKADASWQTDGDVFRNMKYGYEVTRPNENWHFQQVNLGGMFLSEFTAMNTKELGSNFTIYSFEKYGPDDSYNPVDDMVEFMGRQLRSFQVYGEKELEVAGLPARSITFSGTAIMPLTVTYTEIFGDERCYIMTYWTMKPQYRKLLPEFEAFRDSFRVLETK